MHSEKKLTKEDTWRPSELRRHIREKDNGDGYSRRREDSDRKRRGEESAERKHRDAEESRRDRDKLRERERRHGDSRDRHAEQRKDRSQDMRGEKDRERRDDKDKRKQGDDGRNYKGIKPDKEKSSEREINRDRHKHKDKEGVKVREEDRDKRREDREKDRRREDQEREHRRERRRHDESGEVRRDQIENLQRELKDRQHRSHHEDKRDKDVQEERRRTEDREYKEKHRRHKEEGERRHKERRHHEEKKRYESESKERQDLKKTDDDALNTHGDKDRTERDKQKERHKKEEEGAHRRHKDRRDREAEEDDVERNHREKNISKKSSSDKKKEENKDEEVASKQQKEDGKNGMEHEENVDLAEQEYEEDFEDYEEDFEDMDESADEGEGGDGEEGQTTQRSKEIEVIRKAMDEENKRAGTSQSKCRAHREEQEEDSSKWSKGSERDESLTSRRGKFIDFVAAKQREVSKKVATKQKKRCTELLRLIDLDFSMTFSLLDIPPVSEYEMYIKSFGNANTKQAYVQCNEDNVDRDVQTEEVETCEKWTQHPPEYSGACGDPNFSQEARDKTRSELTFDSQCLMSFLRSASQVMVVLLEEDQTERKSLRKLKTQTDSLSFCNGSLQLNTKLPFLLGRQINLVHFSQVQKHIMLSVHMPTAKPSSVRLDSCTIICVWNIWEPSRPQKILIYESEVQCCCFSPGNTLVFAGTEVGSVVLWDLREYANNHYRLKIDNYEWTFRHPTFSTDAVMSSQSHVSPVNSIEVVPSFEAGGLRQGVPLLASEDELTGLSFQLASLDESGVINFWVVVELAKGNEAGSPTELGLRPGGKVKLLHSSSLLTVQRSSLKEAAKMRPFQTLLLKYHPTDSNHFFIGTNLGLVRHGTSHSSKAHPQFYHFQEVEERTVDVTSIHFSPFSSYLFLVGCADGSIRLHAVSSDQPVAEWMNSTAGEPVISLQWTQTRPAVFCVLDAASNLHIWDMLKDEAQPILTEKFTTDRVTAMAVFGDSGQQNTYSGIALAHKSGKVELLYLTQTLTVPNPAEERKLETMMTEAF